MPRNLHQLIPFYARFATIINVYFQEVGSDLARMLKQEFDQIQEQIDVIKVDVKVRNIRFIGELTKFGLIPAQETLSYLKRLSDEFIGHNIDLISNVLEVCGPFLVRSVDESVQRVANNILDRLIRLKEKELIPSK